MAKTFDEITAIGRIESKKTIKDINLMILSRLQNAIQRYPEKDFNQLLFELEIVRMTDTPNTSAVRKSSEIFENMKSL